MGFVFSGGELRSDAESKSMISSARGNEPLASVYLSTDIVLFMKLLSVAMHGSSFAVRLSNCGACPRSRLKAVDSDRAVDGSVRAMVRRSRVAGRSAANAGVASVPN